MLSKKLKLLSQKVINFQVARIFDLEIKANIDNFNTRTC